MKTFISKYRIILIALCCMIVSVNGRIYAQSNSLEDLRGRAVQQGISENQVARIIEKGRASGLNESQLLSIIEPAISLAEQDLPHEFIIQKAFEGLAKGVPGQTLSNVLNAMKSSTIEARNYVDPWIQNPEIQEMIQAGGAASENRNIRKQALQLSAKALNQGIPAQTLDSFLNQMADKSITSRATPGDLLTALSILPDLPGGDSRMSQDLVISALKSGFNASDLRKLPSAVQISINRNSLPAAGVIEGVINQLQTGNPARTVLQNLFNGNFRGSPPEGIPGRGRNNGKQGRGNSNNGNNNNH